MPIEIFEEIGLKAEKERFRELLEKLKGKPIEHPYWESSKKICRENLSKVPLDTTDLRFLDPLVPVDEVLPQVPSENYFYKLKKKDPEIYKELEVSPLTKLRRPLLEILAKVQTVLETQGLGLIIHDGHRNLSTQKKAREIYASKFGWEKANRVYSDPSPFAPHHSGGAVDLDIIETETGKRIPSKPQDIKEKFDFSKKEDKELFESLQKELGCKNLEEKAKRGKLDPREEEILKSRRLLYHLLCTPKSEGGILEEDEIFVGQPHEYWHFDKGDFLAAYLTDAKAYYGPVDENGRPLPLETREKAKV